MEFLTDANLWLGFVTLVLLEIVLGIDNLIFIAILADKLSAEKRDHARIVGLSLALVMRLSLLFFLGWAARLSYPLFSVFGKEISAHDLTMLLGGAFLLAKGTMELHERLEGIPREQKNEKVKVYFWQVIAQIVVLDAIFSLDSIITAVGMVNNMLLMSFAVIVAMGVMMLASGPLVRFVSRHPTVVILCLGFLMMIGFSLVLDGLGILIPKEYLYTAIGYSVLIEAFNQIGRRNKEKYIKTKDMRSRTADAVLRLLGGRGENESNLSETVDVIAEYSAKSEVFHPEEKQMIKAVLDLADRSVRSIMTPRNEVEWLNLAAEEEVQKQLQNFKHSRIILARGKIDEFIGVASTKDLLSYSIEGKKINWRKALRQPLVIHENASVLTVIEKLRLSLSQLAIIVDEHGSFEGIITPTDILEAIAGDFIDEGEEQVSIIKEEEGTILVDASIDLRRLSSILEKDLVEESDRYTTLAGYMLWHFGYLPTKGESFKADNFRFEVVEMERRNIEQVRITPLQEDEEEEGN